MLTPQSGWLAQMTLSTKLLGSFLFIALLLLLTSLVSIYGQRSMQQDLVEIGANRIPASISFNQINFERMVIRAQTLEVVIRDRGTETERAELRRIMEQRQDSWERVDRAIAASERLTRQTADEATMYEQFMREYRAWRAIYERLDGQLARLASETDATAYARLHRTYVETVAEMIPLSERMGTTASRLAELNHLNAMGYTQEAKVNADFVIKTSAFFIVLGLALAVFLGWFISRDVLAILGGEPREVIAAVNRVAQGDLTTNLHVRPGDERSMLAAFARMVESMREILGEVFQVSHQVASSSQQLNATTESTNQQFQRQQSEIDQVATAMNQMSATVAEVARHASQAAQAAQDATHEANNGNTVVMETAQAIEKLAEDVGRAADVITALSDDTREITTVLDVIRGVAEQTNLLALNAAIEAARAGEQGRGFAVVADEVRTLASRTQVSTQEIQQKIERLQSSAANAVEVMGQGQKRAAKSVDQARQAGASLDTISRTVNNMSDANLQIASASEEQSAVAEEINRNLQNITQSVDQTAQGSRELAMAGEELARVAASLQRRIERFRV